MSDPEKQQKIVSLNGSNPQNDTEVDPNAIRESNGFRRHRRGDFKHNTLPFKLPSFIPSLIGRHCPRDGKRRRQS